MLPHNYKLLFQLQQKVTFLPFFEYIYPYILLFTFLSAYGWLHYLILNRTFAPSRLLIFVYSSSDYITFNFTFYIFNFQLFSPSHFRLFPSSDYITFNFTFYIFNFQLFTPSLPDYIAHLILHFTFYIFNYSPLHAFVYSPWSDYIYLTQSLDDILTVSRGSRVVNRNSNWWLVIGNIKTFTSTEPFWFNFHILNLFSSIIQLKNWHKTTSKIIIELVQNIGNILFVLHFTLCQTFKSNHRNYKWYSN